MGKMRAEEKEGNHEVIQDSREAAVAEAVQILKDFYAKGSHAAATQVLLQKEKKKQEPPAGAEPLGAYKGNQGEGHRIIAMLQKVQKNFERVYKETKDEEEKAAREFSRFMRENKSTVAGKDTEEKLKTNELEQTKIALEEGMEDLKASQKLLDAAIKELDELKPACVDTGMTFEARAAKREDEVAALKKAMEILSKA